jgi:anti-sigma factor RsiW
MQCKAVVDLMSDHIEGALPLALLACFEDHLVACSHCASYLRQMQMTIAAMKALRRWSATPEIPGSC